MSKTFLILRLNLDWSLSKTYSEVLFEVSSSLLAFILYDISHSVIDSLTFPPGVCRRTRRTTNNESFEQLWFRQRLKSSVRPDTVSAAEFSARLSGSPPADSRCRSSAAAERDQLAGHVRSSRCEYSFLILTSVRGMQVACRYSDECQRYAGTL